MISQLDKRAVCITRNIYLWAEISSIFHQQWMYFSIIETPPNMWILTDWNITKVVNSIAITRPDYVILADIEYTIQEKILERFPDHKILIIIKTTNDIDNNIIKKLWINIEWEILCTKDSLIYWLYLAKYEKKRLIIDDDRSSNEYVFSTRKSKELICIEETWEISDIIAVNYAFANEMDLLLIPWFSRQQVDNFCERIKIIGNSDHTIDKKYIDWNKIKEEIYQRFPSFFKFEKYYKILFVTGGIPYSFIFNNEIPIAQVYNYFLWLHFIWCYIYFQMEIMPVNNVLLLATKEFENAEVKYIESLFESMDYNITKLYGKNATIENWLKYIQFLPYSILHIATHWWDKDDFYWYNITEKFIDSKWETHIIKYKELPIIESIDSKQDKCKVLLYKEFDTFDGKKSKKAQWISEWIDIDKWKFNNWEIIERNNLSEPLKNINWILFSDWYGLLTFHQVAAWLNPIIFNCSCSSIKKNALNFISSGAIWYIWTLWDIESDVAQRVSESFYKNIKNMPPYAALWYAQKIITNKHQENIFVYFWADNIIISSSDKVLKDYWYKTHLKSALDRWWLFLNENKNKKDFEDALQNAEIAFNFLNRILFSEFNKSILSNKYFNCGLYKKSLH